MASASNQPRRGVGTPGLDAFSLFQSEVDRAVEERAGQLLLINDAADAAEAAARSVDDLPTKLSHRVLVPMGKHAFFQGEMRHTNELTVSVRPDFSGNQLGRV